MVNLDDNGYQSMQFLLHHYQSLEDLKKEDCTNVLSFPETALTGSSVKDICNELHVLELHVEISRAELFWSERVE